MTKLADVYLYVFDEYLTTTTDVAIALFDERDHYAERTLEEIAESELIKRVGDDSWMAVPNSDHIERDEAVENAKEFSDLPVFYKNTNEPEFPKHKYLRPDRARENFQALIDDAPSETAREFWEARLAEVDG